MNDMNSEPFKQNRSEFLRDSTVEQYTGNRSSPDTSRDRSLYFSTDIRRKPAVISYWVQSENISRQSAEFTLRTWLKQGRYSIALSPGFFGYFAHIGVLSALDEAGLLEFDKIEHLAGSSAGEMRISTFISRLLRWC